VMNMIPSFPLPDRAWVAPPLSSINWHTLC
jgi:hypothetical protein